MTTGHFRVPKTFTFEMRLGAQPFLSCENEGGGGAVGEANKKGLKRVFQNKLLISVDQNTF